MKAVFLDFASMGPDLDLSRLQAILPELMVFDASSPEEVIARVGDVEIVLTNKKRFDAALFEQNPALRYIGLSATGTDNIDLVAAAKHSVAVANIRDYCTRSVAEHVFAGLLSLTRNQVAVTRSVSKGEWRRADNFCLLHHPIRELSSMTLGIVGYGALGKGVADTGAALGMRVLISDRPGATSSTLGRVPFDDLVQQVDVLSLHCPLNERTQNLIDRGVLQSMRQSAYLVNTARGGLVDSEALVDALRSEDIGGAVIDVLSEEPPIHGDPLLDYRGDNLILTPHIAWASRKARQTALDEVVENVAAYLRGDARNLVTPTGD